MLQRIIYLLAITAAFFVPSAIRGDGDKIQVLIIDGQHNHKWRETTAFLKQQKSK